MGLKAVLDHFVHIYRAAVSKQTKEVHALTGRFFSDVFYEFGLAARA